MPATKSPIAKQSSYRLPCVYCNNETTFPSSEKLKEHLLLKHKNNVCGSRQSVEPPPEKPSYYSELTFFNCRNQFKKNNENISWKK